MADHRRRHRLAPRAPSSAVADAGDAQHDQPLGHGPGHQRVVVGQRAQGVGELGVARRQGLGIDRRRVAVALGEQDVAGDHRRPQLAQPAEQLREHRARPRPLADRGQAGIVDVDDRHRHRRLRRPRMERLQLVEDLEPEGLDDGRIEDVEEDEKATSSEPIRLVGRSSWRAERSAASAIARSRGTTSAIRPRSLSVLSGRRPASRLHAPVEDNAAPP